MLHKLKEPDWNAPLDLDSVVDAVPEHMTVKGMSINAIGAALRSMGKTAPVIPQQVAFKDCSQREMVRWLVLATREGLPHLPPREALRRLGVAHLSGLQETLIMRVLLAGLGSSLGIQAAARALPRVYRAVTSHERVEVLVNETGKLRLHYRDTYTFAHSFQVGTLLGGFEVFKLKPAVATAEVSVSEAVVEFSW